MRERVADLLLRTGALGALLRVRQRAPGVAPMLPIVTYHHITDDDPAYPFDRTIADATPAQFRRHMELVARYCTPISIAELVAAIDGAPLPKNPVMVTFDDGYRSCHDVALPILRTVGVRATFFVSTSYITERRLYWWERISLVIANARRNRVTISYPAHHELDRRDAGLRDRLVQLVRTAPALDVERFLDELGAAFGVDWDRSVEAGYSDQLIMSWDQVRALVAGDMDVESHGNRHRVLQTLDKPALDDELAGSRKELEAQIHRRVHAIAYPVGRRIAREPRIRHALAAAGYRIGFSNISGTSRIARPLLRGMLPLDPFDIHRLSTNRAFSDAMFLAQIAIPQMAYVSNINAD
jgi:peptidoglycan/xylan/chitin deacetylase (PgdA/CDA1 family)